MNENMIEMIAEREMDELDERYLNGMMTDEEYNSRVRAINEWVRFEYMGQAMSRERGR